MKKSKDIKTIERGLRKHLNRNSKFLFDAGLEDAFVKLCQEKKKISFTALGASEPELRTAQYKVVYGYNNITRELSLNLPNFNMVRKIFDELSSAMAVIDHANQVES